MALTFSDYQDALRRFNYTPHWNLPRWGNALAGEVGEACNLIKKIDRGNVGDPNLDEAREALGEEIADIVAYAMHLANAVGIDIEQATRKKYDKVSLRLGRFLAPLPD